MTSSYDCVIISETKIDDSFSTKQVFIPGYKIPHRADRNIYGGGLLVYIKETLKSRRTDQFEEKGIENICFELNLRKVQWAIVAAYNLPNANNKNFKNTIIRIVDKISLHYDNFIIIGDVTNETEKYL